MPERYLVEAPDGRAGAIRDLRKFADGRGKKGWVIVGETRDGSDVRYPKAIKGKALQELADQLDPIEPEEVPSDEEPPADGENTPEVTSDRQTSQPRLFGRSG